MKLHLRSAEFKDLELLTEMNKQLIEDEGSSNPMSLAELRQRMKEWLQGSWNTDLIMNNDEVIGYALYCFKENQYDNEIKEVYLRQYL